MQDLRALTELDRVIHEPARLLIVSILALLGGLYFWGQKDAWLSFSLDFLRQRVETWFYILPLVWLVLMVELYDLHRAKNLRQTVRGIAIARKRAAERRRNPRPQHGA